MITLYRLPMTSGAAFIHRFESNRPSLHSGFELGLWYNSFRQVGKLHYAGLATIRGPFFIE